MHEGQHENVIGLTLDLINNKMGLDPPIDVANIDRIHRTGPKPKPNSKYGSRPILVKFSTYQVRRRVLKDRTKLKDLTPTPIYINEDLTKARATIMREARKRKKDKQINDC